MRPVTEQLILCADDFALSPPVSAAIASLAADGRINATSCMAMIPGWIDEARLLRDLDEQTAIGLHIVLTDLPPLGGASALAPRGTLPPLGQLARHSLLGTLPREAIRAEVEAQFDRFGEGLGRMPDFVDGHQHCHHLPAIRDIVLDITARRAPNAWLRDCSDRISGMAARPFAWKALRSAAWSAGFRAAAGKRGLIVNDGFAGHYDFRRPYSALFARFLARPGRRHLVMCHPGGGMLAGDTIAEARIAEREALAGLPVRALAEAAGLSFDSRFDPNRLSPGRAEG